MTHTHHGTCWEGKKSPKWQNAWKTRMIQDCYLHLFPVAVTSEPSFPHDLMESHIEEKQWEITFSDLRKQHDHTGRNPSLMCHYKLYPWECIATHLHAKKQTQTSSEPVIIINAGMKGNGVGLVQGSRKERVSSGVSVVTSFKLGITLGSTAWNTGVCEYGLQSYSVIYRMCDFNHIFESVTLWTLK